ncbi:hypothetical protein MNKW57_12010 [Biformimicrobium ophioploci]|uniref:Uncharacterized protein n=1 Tax=Biformimicrobium ophioploci TaxID=3036711 RepID=A0ABQ6LXS6_9GAMM|nr:hypothetical protein MNKW57_12010 [Microbulbifer sp. NKW57]
MSANTHKKTLSAFERAARSFGRQPQGIYAVPESDEGRRHDFPSTRHPVAETSRYTGPGQQGNRKPQSSDHHRANRHR